MKWIMYLFVISISFGLIKRNKGKTIEYVAWIILSIILGFGLLLI